MVVNIDLEFSQELFVDKRSYARKGITLDGIVTVGSDDRACQLIDISSGGARLRLAGDYDKDQPVVLKIPDIGSFDATVRWVRNGTAGLHFAGDADEIGELLYDFLVYGVR